MAGSHVEGVCASLLDWKRTKPLTQTHTHTATSHSLPHKPFVAKPPRRQCAFTLGRINAGSTVWGGATARARAHGTRHTPTPHPLFFDTAPSLDENSKHKSKAFDLWCS
jgi:hypothetical protein